MAQVSLVSVGSRGDIQPYVTFGVFLRGLGYEVRVCSEERHKQLILGSGLEFGRIYGDCTGALYEKDMQAALETGSLFKMISATKEWDAKFSKEEMLRSYVSALAGSELILCGGLSLTQSICVAEYMRVPVIPLILGPTLPTQEFPIWPLASLVWSKCQNKWSYNFLFRTLWNQEKPYINRWRESELGLAPWTTLKNGVADITAELPVIIACSRIVLPNKQKPADYPANAHLRGFIFHHADTITEGGRSNQAEVQVQTGPQGLEGLEALTAFIAKAKLDGKKLVYLGFGSMPCSNPSRLVGVANELCSRLDCRAVLLANWPSLHSPASGSTSTPASTPASTLASTLAPAPAPVSASADVLMVPFAPHSWLFPQMDCLIHHCGIGTLASGLLAGVPTIPCPYGMDQPHNAKLLLSLGVAPAVVKYNKSMTAASLAVAVGRVFGAGPEGERLRQSAREWREVLLEEDKGAMPAYAEVVAEAIGKWSAVRAGAGAGAVTVTGAGVV